MRIAFLHTIEANRQVFAAASEALGVSDAPRRHLVRPELREAAQAAGGTPASLIDAVRRCVSTLASDADAVVVTCASLGPALAAIEAMEAMEAMEAGDGGDLAARMPVPPVPPVPVVRADLALAAQAGATRGRLVVLCALDAVVEPTRALFARHAGDGVTAVAVTVVAGAWALFQRDALDACLDAIAAAADAAYAAGAAEVAFAHPWMAPAAARVRDARRPFDAARAALAEAKRRAARDPA